MFLIKKKQDGIKEPRYKAVYKCLNSGDEKFINITELTSAIAKFCVRGEDSLKMYYLSYVVPIEKDGE